MRHGHGHRRPLCAPARRPPTIVGGPLGGPIGAGAADRRPRRFDRGGASPRTALAGPPPAPLAGALVLARAPPRPGGPVIGAGAALGRRWGGGGAAAGRRPRSVPIAATSTSPARRPTPGMVG